MILKSPQTDAFDVDEIALRVLFFGDGRKGMHVRDWLVDASNVGRHGWALVQTIASEPTTPGAPRVADGILAYLERLGMIERGKRELRFAPEILAFGVGGMPGAVLERHGEYPCLFYWTPTRRLQRFTHWLTTLDAAFAGDLAGQIYAFARQNPDA